MQRCWDQSPHSRPKVSEVLRVLLTPPASRLSQAEAEKDREKQHLFLAVKVVTDETFSRHEGFDLATLVETNSPLSELPTLYILKQETYGVFKSRVAKYFGYSEGQIRLWEIFGRQNKTIRAGTYIADDKPWLSVLSNLRADHF